MTIEEKYGKLLSLIAETSGAAVAFSGGVDSSFLCRAAVEALGPKAIAISVATPLQPRWEIEEAVKLARLVGIEQVLIERISIPEVVAENLEDRCYHCKKVIFGAILAAASERGIGTVLDGSNYDDLSDYRPGLRALAELEVASPLKEAGLTKAEIRELSRRFGLPTWDKSAFACLATRIPYGEPIDAKKLRRVEEAEDFLRAAGFRQFRVRCHGDLARIEVARDERRAFFDEGKLDSISRSLKERGFLYVAFELEGYDTGSMNRTIRRIP